LSSFEATYADIIASVESYSGCDAAIRLQDEFDRKIETVADFPYFAKYDDTDYHHVTVWNYVIFYQIDEAKREVRFYRIIHGARNIADLL